MTAFLIALLLQSLPLPPRAAMENPAVLSPVPQKLKKDYDKLWARFTAGKDDAKLAKYLNNLLKKQKNFDPAVMIEAYIELYKGNDAAAARKFEQVLVINPNNRGSQYLLAEISFTRGDYGRASVLYGQLLAADKTRTDLEMKRQKALLLATENLLRSATRAEQENRLDDAEGFYRQALNIAPKEPVLRLRLADLLTRAKKTDEAAAEKKIADELMPRRMDTVARNDDAKVNELEDLGRWGNQIEWFRKIQTAESVTREQFAALVVRYFPQVTEFRQNPQILTDIQDSWALSEIQIAVGVALIDPLPNHSFEPAARVNRGTFALAMARLIRMLGLSQDNAAPLSAPDVAPSNALHGDIGLVLGYSLMTLQDSGDFNAGGEVRGREAVAAAERLLRSFQQPRQ